MKRVMKSLEQSLTDVTQSWVSKYLNSIKTRTREIKREEPFTLEQVSIIVGLPSHLVTNWTTGKPFRVGPSFRLGKGTGNRRLYNTRDVLTFLVIKELRNSGLTTKFIKNQFNNRFKV